MSEEKGHKDDKMNDGYIDYQGGYISYDPTILTEHYTVKGFEDKIENPHKSKSRWC
ncbi:MULTISPECIES: hypothetical protein [unclassified Clostridium]|uniref:hypothetical protein n=1 Tax=unclassified Clostridium TaxID=2614128 RepID=UPI0002984504|nr:MULTISPECIES: hypothetical protein [unclassified Clostridium]EKQ54420.1 MAG: hypothetical protein A370_03244 [Clostridium sp. Maddingley MBC34-26]